MTSHAGTQCQVILWSHTNARVAGLTGGDGPSTQDAEPESMLVSCHQQAALSSCIMTAHVHSPHMVLGCSFLTGSHPLAPRAILAGLTLSCTAGLQPLQIVCLGSHSFNLMLTPPPHPPTIISAWHLTQEKGTCCLEAQELGEARG